MDMRFGTWNVRCMYKADGVEVVMKQQANIHFSMEKGMKIINYVQVFLYIRESCQQLRGLSSLVVGCNT
jgi:hypothetical protein